MKGCPVPVLLSSLSDAAEGLISVQMSLLSLMHGI